MSKSFFGNYNLYIDTGMHIFFSALVALFFFVIKQDLFLAGATFVVGLLVDIDHLLNPFLSRVFHLPLQGIGFGGSGVTIRVLHGFDVACLIGLAGYALTDTGVFGVFLAANLILHELWDFVVYSHKATELFLVTRLSKRFMPGQRDYFRGVFFNEGSLKM